jgi:predicted dehydrogenase
LVGISGIGGYHRGIMHDADYMEFVAAADKWLERPHVAEAAEALAEQEVPVYGDVWEMLDAVDVEAVVIATPHPFHAPYTDGCLDRGLHVLCEKPFPVLAADGMALVQKARQKELFVGVDFQFAGYDHSLALKDLICNGDLGELVEIVGVMEWKRTDEYYQRADWVGKRYYEGLPCWDGVLMNQAVHLLNSALHMGTREHARAVPERLQAEMYRVHDIECEDTACLRADLGEATLHFYATTCCEDDVRTSLDIIGTKGRATWDTSKAVVNIDGKDEIVFDMPTDRNAIHANLMNCVRGVEKELLAAASESVKPTLTINAAYLSTETIARVSADDLGDIRSLMDQAADERKLLSEMGVSWGRQTEVVEQAEFTSFKGLADD